MALEQQEEQQQQQQTTQPQPQPQPEQSQQQTQQQMQQPQQVPFYYMQYTPSLPPSFPTFTYIPPTASFSHPPPRSSLPPTLAIPQFPQPPPDAYLLPNASNGTSVQTQMRYPPSQQQFYSYPISLQPQSQQQQQTQIQPQPQPELQAQPQNENTTESPSITGESPTKLASSAVTLYFLGLIFFFPYIFSVWRSFRMARLGCFDHNNKAVHVLLCGLAEIFAWCFVIGYSWHGGEECHRVYDYTYGYGYHTECSYHWNGWISVVIWYLVSLTLGAWRVYTSHTSRVIPEPLQPITLP